MNLRQEKNTGLKQFLVFACVFILTELYFINIFSIGISVHVLGTLMFLPSALTEG